MATTLPDDIITQRENAERAAEEEEQEADAETRPRRRKPARLLEAVTKVEPEEKCRGKRQKDFDISEQNESSDEESQKKERSRAAEEPWTQNQQKLLEMALQQYPKGASDRWDKIARCVPAKSKVSEWEEGARMLVQNPTTWLQSPAPTSASHTNLSSAVCSHICQLSSSMFFP